MTSPVSKRKSALLRAFTFPLLTSSWSKLRFFRIWVVTSFFAAGRTVVTPFSCSSALFFLSEQEVFTPNAKHNSNHIHSCFFIFIGSFISIISLLPLSFHNPLCFLFYPQLKDDRIIIIIKFIIKTFKRLSIFIIRKRFT